LSETVTLYARLAQANRSLQRERTSKMMSLEAAVAAVSHQIKQPLAAIATRSAAARRFLAQTPPNIDRAKAIQDEVASAAFRANEVVESVHALFKDSDQPEMPVDVNELIHESLQVLRK